MQWLVKCYDNKMVKSPLTWVIYLLTQPQVANQQKEKEKNVGFVYSVLISALLSSLTFKLLILLTSVAEDSAGDFTTFGQQEKPLLKG